MFAFVILHYKNLDDTLECVASLKKIKGKKKIVVVDNHTLDEENSKILKKEVDDLILLEENLGFAKANNLGIKTAQKKYNPDFIAVLNNDIVIDQKEFIEIVKEDYQKYHFDMLGGKINTPGGSVNPFPAFEDRNRVLQEIKYAKKLIFIYKSAILTFLLKLYMKIKRVFIKPKIKTNGKTLKKQVPLHGCALVFSKDYLEKYQDPFYSKTFLFHEEDFIYQRIKKDNLVSVYDPKLEVYHKEGSSLKTTIKNERKKLLYREEERLKSLYMLEKYIREEIE